MMARIAATATVSLFIAISSFGQAAVGAPITSADRSDLQRVERYLDSLTTVQADFVQTTNNADLLRGHFYLKRPGKMRIEYEPPVSYYTVADGTWLTFYDPDLKQRKDVPLGSTIADFVTRPNLKLSGDVTVVDISRHDGVLDIRVVQSDKPAEGSLTLKVSLNPMELQGWVTADGQGAIVQVDLTRLQSGVSLENSLFSVPRGRSHR